MLLTLFLEIILSIFAAFGIFMLFYLIFSESYRKCKREEEKYRKSEEAKKILKDKDGKNGRR